MSAQNSVLAATGECSRIGQALGVQMTPLVGKGITDSILRVASRGFTPFLNVIEVSKSWYGLWRGG